MIKINRDSTSVLIGIVTHNHRRLIPACLDSIARRRDQHVKVEVVVVDNCSNDGSADLVRSSYPWVQLIRQSKRCSFAENNNLAFAAGSSQYFLMLNPDTELQPDSVSVLVDFMQARPACGVCGPKLVFPDGSLQFSCRRFPTAWSTLLRRTAIRLVVPAEKRGIRHLMASEPHERDMEVDWMLGACLLIRREAIPGRKVLDDGFPLYCEDIDLCLRVAMGGWKVYYVPRTTVVHHHMARSDSKLFCRESFLHARSMLHFIKKHYLVPSRNSALYPGVTNIQRTAA
ncbi:MAG TPA: glycosyltransferase family 2 protein [Terriglobales bacterium]|jgi:GT2 family glycosyltransferase|nr:glycosyltransferase family 2 protein [Terriglobales bacterium]